MICQVNDNAPGMHYHTIQPVKWFNVKLLEFPNPRQILSFHKYSLVGLY